MGHISRYQSPLFILFYKLNGDTQEEIIPIFQFLGNCRQINNKAVFSRQFAENWWNSKIPFKSVYLSKMKYIKEGRDVSEDMTNKLPCTTYS